MKTTWNNIFVFASGATIGSVVTWIFLKKRYEQRAQEEINSVKEVYARRNGISYEELADVKPEEVAVDATQVGASSVTNFLKEHAAIVKKMGYTQYSDSDHIVKSEEVTDVSAKRVFKIIAPEELGECGYDVKELTYYADGVLTDDHDEIIEDVDMVVGKDFADHFGDYEDDSVHIRDDANKIDYEILLDPCTYSDAVNKNPHLAEDK